MNSLELLYGEAVSCSDIDGIEAEKMRQEIKFKLAQFKRDNARLKNAQNRGTSWIIGRVYWVFRHSFRYTLSLPGMSLTSTTFPIYWVITCLHSSLYTSSSTLFPASFSTSFIVSLFSTFLFLCPILNHILSLLSTPIFTPISTPFSISFPTPMSILHSSHPLAPSQSYPSYPSLLLDGASLVSFGGVSNASQGLGVRSDGDGHEDSSSVTFSMSDYTTGNFNYFFSLLFFRIDLEWIILIDVILFLTRITNKE